MITKLILSPGEIDMDDALAASILLAKEPSIVSIDRYHPDQGEFEDSTLAIVGMGINKPSRSVFGGQAGALDLDIVASCSSVAEHYGMLDLCQHVFPWWEMVETTKTEGMIGAADMLEIAHGTAFAKLYPGPFGDMVIDRINKAHGEAAPCDPPWDMLHMFGEWIVFSGKKRLTTMELLAPDSAWERHTGQKILGFRHLPEGVARRDLGLWCIRHPEVIATVIHDEAEGGWTIYSRDLQEISLRHLAHGRYKEHAGFVNREGSFARLDSVGFEEAMAIAIMLAQATSRGGVWTEIPWKG